MSWHELRAGLGLLLAIAFIIGGSLGVGLPTAPADRLASFVTTQASLIDLNACRRDSGGPPGPVFWCRRRATLRMFRFRNAIFRLVSVESTLVSHRR